METEVAIHKRTPTNIMKTVETGVLCYDSDEQENENDVILLNQTPKTTSTQRRSKKTSNP